MMRRLFSGFPGIVAFCLLTLGLVSDPIAFVAGDSLPAAGSAHAQTAAVKPLSANDVSWLFPKPTNLDDLISMADLKAHARAVWSNAAFRQLPGIASGPVGRVAGTNRRIEPNTAQYRMSVMRRERMIASRNDLKQGASNASKAQTQTG